MVEAGMVIVTRYHAESDSYYARTVPHALRLPKTLNCRFEGRPTRPAWRVSRREFSGTSRVKPRRRQS